METPRHQLFLFEDVAFELDDSFEAVEFGEPTDYPPGSMGKIETLAIRVELGLKLWHPADKQLDQQD